MRGPVPRPSARWVPHTPLYAVLAPRPKREMRALMTQPLLYSGLAGVLRWPRLHRLLDILLLPRPCLLARARLPGLARGLKRVEILLRRGLI